MKSIFFVTLAELLDYGDLLDALAINYWQELIE